MNLSERSRRIALAAQFHADSPVSWLKKKTGIKEHSIYSDLRAMREAGVIHPRVFVDIHALGLVELEVYLSVNFSSPEQKTSFFRELLSSDVTLWVGELSGAYNVGLSLCAKDSREAHRAFDAILNKVGVVATRVQSGVLVSLTVYRKNYLCDEIEVEQDSEIHLHYNNEYTCDALDRRVIAALFKSRQASIRNVAKEAGIPRTTFEYRMERLKENGVISPRCFIINPLKLNLEVNRLLISLQSCSLEAKEDIVGYFRANPRIVNLKHLMGSVEFEITIESETEDHVAGIEKELKERFGRIIANMERVKLHRQCMTAGFLKHEDGNRSISYPN